MLNRYTNPDQIPVYLVYTVCALAVYTALMTHWHTLTVTRYTGAIVIQCIATLELHWAYYSVCTVYTASVRPVYTLTTLEFGLGIHPLP